MVTFPAAKFATQDALDAALDWWRDAGVDQDFADLPRNWLAQPVPVQSAEDVVAQQAPASRAAPAAPPAPPLQRIGGDQTIWPRDLEAFHDWWLTEPSLDAGQVMRRVAPRGVAGAQIMVIVDHPEADDTQHLLAGPRGAFVNDLLRAIGIAPDQAYFASVLARHMPMPDWAALGDAGLGDLAQHHLALVAPKRVIAFGGNVSSLLGHDPAKSAQPLPQICRLGAGVPAIAAPDLGNLRWQAKARLWQMLLDWADN